MSVEREHPGYPDVLEHLLEPFAEYEKELYRWKHHPRTFWVPEHVTTYHDFPDKVTEGYMCREPKPRPPECLIEIYKVRDSIDTKVCKIAREKQRAIDTENKHLKIVENRKIGAIKAAETRRLKALGLADVYKSPINENSTLEEIEAKVYHPDWDNFNEFCDSIPKEHLPNAESYTIDYYKQRRRSLSATEAAIQREANKLADDYHYLKDSEKYEHPKYLEAHEKWYQRGVKLYKYFEGGKNGYTKKYYSLGLNIKKEERKRANIV